MTPMSSLQSLQPPPATPISTDMMSPSGVRINLGAAAATASPKPNERRNSHSGVSPLDDQSKGMCVCLHTTFHTCMKLTMGVADDCHIF